MMNVKEILDDVDKKNLTGRDDHRQQIPVIAQGLLLS
jgi:hypothetical protein